MGKWEGEKQTSFQHLTNIGWNLNNNLSVKHTLWAMQEKTPLSQPFYAPSTDPQRI